MKNEQQQSKDHKNLTKPASFHQFTYRKVIGVGAVVQTFTTRDNWELAITICAGGTIVCCQGAITGIPIVLFHTFSPIPALHPVAATVALAAWIHSWGNVGLFLQVKGHTIDS